jgi:hypothetical protein
MVSGCPKGFAESGSEAAAWPPLPFLWELKDDKSASANRIGVLSQAPETGVG